LFVYPEKYGLPAIIIETNMTTKGEAVSVLEMEGYNPIYSGVIGQNSLEVRKETCYESTSGFSSCMVCAMGVITDDWIGLAACTANPEACFAASAIHCSGVTSLVSSKDI